MEDKNTEIFEKLKKEYPTACRQLQLLKKDKTKSEVADIERRCVFTKYMFCKMNSSEDVAGEVLRNELNKYTDLIDDSDYLNNYWEQFSSLNVETDNNPLDWKPVLTDPQTALQFLEPLPCNTDNTLGCKNAQFTDRDVEKLMELWNNAGNSPLKRKTPREAPKIVKQQSQEDNYEQKMMDVQNEDDKHESKMFDTHNREDNYKPKTFKKHDQEKKYKSILKQRSVFESFDESKPSTSFQREPLLLERKEEQSKKILSFKTAREVAQQSVYNKQPVKKSLGGRAISSPFVCPFKDEKSKEEPKVQEKIPEPTDERLKNIDAKMIELIRNEIMDCGNPISWDDIAGLEHAKKIIKEIVVFPMLRPDIFTGLRRPPKGILLFGPPGTGKTLIGKCIAAQSKSTFFSISASSLTSKWIGEGEKMVRALFAVAKVEQPSVVFIDEIDSLLCQRSETEHESSRRMKTEFLVQLDGAATGDEDRILVIGATNRPYELDEAARRRLVKRLYIPLPELEARAQIIRNLLKTERNNLTREEVLEVARLADGYSGADMTNLCKEASMEPIRTIPFDQLENINKEDVREVTFSDFKNALNAIRPSVSSKDLSVYIDWDCTYGTSTAQSRK